MDHPIWEIKLYVGIIGEVRVTEVLHHGKVANSKSDWTDRTTIMQVIEWANRVTACDANLTSLHLTLV